jgi:uncharacterized C2H2 Zn-finger protein
MNHESCRINLVKAFVALDAHATNPTRDALFFHITQYRKPILDTHSFSMNRPKNQKSKIKNQKYTMNPDQKISARLKT